jgi:hypothetical protein
MTPILMSPVVKFLASLQFKATVGFSVGEAVLGLTILMLHKTRKTGPAQNNEYFGMKFTLSESEIPNKTSINSVIAAAYTNTHWFSENPSIPRPGVSAATPAAIPLENLRPPAQPLAENTLDAIRRAVPLPTPSDKGPLTLQRSGGCSNDLHLTLDPPVQIDYRILQGPSAEVPAMTPQSNSATCVPPHVLKSYRSAFSRSCVADAVC